MSLESLDGLTGRLAETGLDCIEVYNSRHKQADVENYKAIAQKYNLKITAGSDFHHSGKGIAIGTLSAFGMTVDDELITGLLLCKK